MPHPPSRLATWLFVAGVVSIDVNPLRVFRYFLLSDLLLILALGLEARQARNGKLYYPKFVLLVFSLYLLSTGISFVRPLHPSLGLFTWLHSAFVMLVYVPAVTTLFVLRPDLRHRALVALLVSVTIQAVLVGYAVVVNGINWQTGTRIAGAFGSTQFSPYAAAAVAAIALLLTASWPFKVTAVVSLGALTAAEIFFRSRMLWVATVFSACVFVIIQSRNKRLGIAAASAACTMCVAGYVLNLYPSAIQARISATIHPLQSPDLVARMRVAEDAASAVVDSPIIGLGIGQSAEHLKELPVPPDIVNAHNIILQAAVEGGIGAALALVMLPLGILLLWEAGRHALPQQRDRILLNWACASLLGIYVSAQLTPTLYEHTFYFLLALLASMALAEGRMRSDAAA